MNYATIINNTDRLFTTAEWVRCNTPKAIAAIDDAVCTTIDNTYLFAHNVYDFFTSENARSWYALVWEVLQLCYAVVLFASAWVEQQFADPRTRPAIVVEPAPQPTPKPAKKPRKPRSSAKKVETPAIVAEAVEAPKNTRKSRAKKSINPVE